MKNRYLQRNFRLTEEENNALMRYAQKTNLSISSYLRMLINGYVPKESPPLEYEKLMQRLNQLYSDPRYHSREFRQLLLQIQAEVTLPERI